jgi:hypothetical protein
VLGVDRSNVEQDRLITGLGQDDAALAVPGVLRHPSAAGEGCLGCPRGRSTITRKRLARLRKMYESGNYTSRLAHTPNPYPRLLNLPEQQRHRLSTNRYL